MRDLGVSFARRFGMKIRDHRTSRLLGRALVVPWRGRIHIIGFEAAARPEFLPQTRLTYWKQELGFSLHSPVDFANERPHASRNAGPPAQSGSDDQR